LTALTSIPTILIFPGIKATLFAVPPRVEISWNGTNPLYSVADTLSMGTLIFETLQSGTADISWDPGSSVTWFLNQSGDTIQPVLIPGTIEVHEIPDAVITSSPLVCEGQNAILEAEITGGTDPIDYSWLTPGGIVPDTRITIENAGNADAGDYTFITSDYFHCVDTAKMKLQILPLPAADFPEVNDTIWFENTYQLIATPGYANYQWSTGDITNYITVTDQGYYSVIIETENGCTSADTVMMMNAAVPVYVPNAFTPNGDGLNDTFKPVVDSELVRQYHLTIYNNWGQLIFETSDTGRGWEGRDAMAGLYAWVISYSDRSGKFSKITGSVALIR